MVRERVQKKSFQQSLDDIKEKMKEKRSKRLQSASATSRGLSKNKSKINVPSSRPLLLKSVQVNNRALARALEEEKAKLRQAQGLLLQMKREQQNLLLHLLIFKRRLQERDQGAGPPIHAQSRPPETEGLGPGSEPFSSSPVRIEPAGDQEAFRLDVCAEEEASQPMNEVCMAEVLDRASLPRTVTVRCRPEGGRSSAHKKGRRSFCQRNGPSHPELFACEGEDPEVAARPAGDQQGEPELKRDLGLLLPQDFGPAQQSTPERPAPPPPAPKVSRPTTARARPERGRKPDRAPLKRPWENAKPRGRSQSRERARKRPGTGAATTAPAADRLNASLGSNDTFDFDCEEAVHLTPFRAGSRAAGEEPGGATPCGGGATPCGSKPERRASPPSPESSPSQDDTDDSPYRPPRKLRQKAGGVTKEEAPPRRARSKRRSVQQACHAQERARDKENLSPKPRPTCKSTEAGRPGDVSQTAGTPESQPAGVPRHPETRRTRSVTDEESRPAGDDGLAPPNFGAESVTALAEADPAPLTPGEEPSVHPPDALLPAFITPATGRKPRPPVTTEKKNRKGGLWARSNRGSGPCDVTNVSFAAFRKFSIGRSLGGPAPAPAGPDSPAPGLRRVRRSTTTINYKEPSLHGKLRRGDKFTDTQFLRSPIFKQKRRSRQSSRTPPPPRSKYDEAFVGCL